ncbi:phage tail protein, partial [Streptococcus equi]
FSVSGKVVRLLKNIGTDLSTVVRKNFNMNDLTIEKNIDSFITYQKGFGAWTDPEDHSKGRLEAEYESPLAKEYGRLEGAPLTDERFTVADNLKEALKSNVENS